MIIIGDVHKEGHEKNYLNKIIDDHKNEQMICLGDLDYGFPETNCPKKFNQNFKFISGNHDNPHEVSKCKNYLGRFGYLQKDNIFFISGAISPDRRRRTSGVDWWPEEELNHTEALRCLNLYQKIKPNIIISHDAPNEIAKKRRYGNSSLTQHIFQMMFEYHQPLYWFYGHYHKKHKCTVRGTRFVCVPLFGYLNLEKEIIKR